MPKTVNVKCDGCELDLTTTGNSIDYRIALLNQRIPSRGGIVTDMMAYPVLPDDAYFCSQSCLRRWVDEHVRP